MYNKIKKSFLVQIIKLNEFHYNNSIEFKKITNLFFKKSKIKKIESIPFIPARLFKEIDLKSIPNIKIFKTLYSSGTSSNTPSKIFLDKENAERQTRVLNEIVTKILGKKRIPMLIIDEKINIDSKNKFDAKTAAIIGFSFFGRNYNYLIKNKKIDYEIFNNFLQNYSKESFLIFGFTSYVYQYLINELDKSKINFDLSKAILIHGGGWKKMSSMNISNTEFKDKLKKYLKINSIYNYYGLIEQTGSIFFECKSCGCFNPSKYSDIIIRDKYFNVLPKKKIGYLQLISLLPTSYPGHSILTEDLGEIIENNCNECKNQKKFLVHGRVEQSEVRGCSDI
jgi:phenylacetate-coenzyme A ligase PaaK-like adenylate-forming protein